MVILTVKQKFLYISDREDIVYVCKKNKRVFFVLFVFFGSSVCRAIIYQDVIER